MIIRLAALALLAAVAPTSGTTAPPITAAAAALATNAATPATLAWVGTWAAAQVAPAPAGVSHMGFRDQTVRDVVHISVGGSELRIRISNLFGTRPLRIADVRVAVRQGNGALIFPGTSHRVTFGGKDTVTIPVGQRKFSDPVRMGVGAGQNLAVSIFVKSATGPATWHPAAIASSYYSTFGDYSSAAGTQATAYRHRIGAWYFLDGLDVVNPAVNGAVVTFGASTSDGVGSTLDANERYPDYLARQLLGLPAGLRLSVLNAGISGNQLLAGGGTQGPSGLSRFYRDALAQTGVRVVIVWLGTNDIGEHPDMTSQQIIAGYQQLIAAAHARGVAVVGATLQPDQGANYYTPQGNRVREEVNQWIRNRGAFDAVADFDAVLRDPFDPAALLPSYDSGDHLHPNDVGYQAIADSIDPWTLAGLAIGYLPGHG
jgi:lysophospholipase L1-like esterase